ncbi:protein-methionine sulfoxide oxidase mical3a-like [Cyclopterus lumpus]|uniref:protein-methionine sulfoxide oxidase mical3a-like n=1 Tax=Cyclopterus lumpus TaxID=8103 RepID=UPI001485FA32|nr:protein-methionine sulfoxide oxidase mical3a-like [Cyclopterus lumpus]
MGEESYRECRAQELFDGFVSASTCRAALWAFSQLCEHLQLDQSATERPLYRPIKRRLNYWRANALWAKLDRRANQQAYLQGGGVCRNTTCVIIGAGPCGLRTAVELSFMGARVVLLEKRDSFSRNNVLHLWPFTIHDLRGLGAKKFYGKFCAGSIDHISIRQLQLVLLKVALLLGVEVHVNVEFMNLVEPPEDQQRRSESSSYFHRIVSEDRKEVGWRMEVSPKSHAVNQLEFDVIIGADGRRNTLPGFRRKEFRGKLAIAITANFKNRNTSAEAKVEEISGVAFIFNQRFFQELRQETGIDLENIVYYKDDTHYFVMTAKKQSLLEKRVIKQDFADTELLLCRANVDQNALQAYACEAADFSTNHQLPSLDFAMNHSGQPDVAVFDFTCMYASENAAMVRQRRGHQLLVSLVGDSLLEPFWPMGTGIARGFLAALDSAWMVQRWSQGEAPLEVLADRESLYRVLPQTTQENLQKKISLFTVDPTTRYLNINLMLITPAQVRHLVDTGEEAGLNKDGGDIIRLPSPRFRSLFSPSNQLLTWCQEETCGYRGVAVNDLTTSWKNGLALCALIHRYRPDLIDFDSLDMSSVEDNTRLSFDVAERHFGISPLMTVDEMNSVTEPDALSMVMYLSQFYQLLKDTLPPAGGLGLSADLRSASLLSRLGLSPSRKRNPKARRRLRVQLHTLSLQEQEDALGQRRRTSQEVPVVPHEVYDEAFVGGAGRSRVRLMANQLQAKLDERSSSSSSSSSAAALRRQVRHNLQRKRTLQQEQMSFRFKEKIKPQTEGQVQRCSAFWAPGCSDVCFFCQKRVYVMERLSAESLFFHRSCFQCSSCSSSLRPAAYAFDRPLRRFYCLQHYDSRSRVTSHRASSASLDSAPSASSADSLISSVVSVVMGATPERMDLQKSHRSSTKLLEEPEEVSEEPEEVSEEPEEVPEEPEEIEEVPEAMLNRFNLSMDEKDQHRSSSESEMEEEDEEGRSHHHHHHHHHRVTPEEARTSWRHTLQQHLHLRDEEEEEEGDEGKSSDEEEFFPLVSQSVSSAAGSDITHYDTPASTLPSCITSFTPPSETFPTANTPSTASFITTSDSAPDEEGDNAPPTPVVQRQPAGGTGWSDDIEKPLLLNDREAGPDGEREWSEKEEAGSNRRGIRGAHSLPPRVFLPPLQGGGGTLLFQLRGPREAPPPRQVEVEVEAGRARTLWRSVFSGNRKERKKKTGRTLPPGPEKDAANQMRATDVRGGLREESDLDSSALLQRCSLKPGNNLRLDLSDLTSEIQRVTIKEEEENQEPAYVPHALAFKRVYAIKVQTRVLVCLVHSLSCQTLCWNPCDGFILSFVLFQKRSLRDRVPPQSSCPTEVVGVLVHSKEPSSLGVKEIMFQRVQKDQDEDLDAKITRRVQRVAQRKAKQEQLKRLHKAQMIQRELQQLEEKQRQLEERGVMVEKALRGEADYWGESTNSQNIELHLEGLGKLDKPALMQQWFQLVQQKNSLVRYESELMIFARELELEDRQSRLQQELRERMTVDDHLKEEWELLEERLILEEMLKVVEQRDSLVTLLEEQRLQQRKEDQDLEEVMMTRGLGLSWT